jgi:hypothetical protein
LLLVTEQMIGIYTASFETGGGSRYKLPGTGGSDEGTGPERIPNVFLFYWYYSCLSTYKLN